MLAHRIPRLPCGQNAPAIFNIRKVDDASRGRTAFDIEHFVSGINEHLIIDNLIASRYWKGSHIKESTEQFYFSYRMLEFYSVHFSPAPFGHISSHFFIYGSDGFPE